MIRKILEAIDEKDLHPSAALAPAKKPLTKGEVEAYFKSIGWVDGDAWEDGEYPGDGWFPPGSQYDFIGTSYKVPPELWDDDDESKWFAMRDDPSVPVARVVNALDLKNIHEIPATLEAIKKAVAEFEEYYEGDD